MQYYKHGFFGRQSKEGDRHEISDEYFDELFDGQANGKEIYEDDNGYPRLRDHVFTEEEKKNNLRNIREPLLKAFDKWEKAVLRGREEDDETVMAWYQAILDLEESAFGAVPERIKYYL